MTTSITMLVELTIRQWMGIKHDKTVSAEVEQTHQAKNAGRYNKYLIDKAHLADISSAANALRKFHYTRTLQWNDGGQRIMPSKLFLEYREEMAKYKQAFDGAVKDFLTKYPQLMQDARMRLGSLYRPEDYPAAHELRDLFAIELKIMPMPDAADFRIDISQEIQDEIRAEITQTIAARQADAVKDCWARMREVVGRIADQCSKEKPVIRESLMENASDLVKVLGGLNITNDPLITQAEAELRSLIVPSTTLRDSPSARRNAANKAAEILQKMPC